MRPSMVLVLTALALGACGKPARQDEAPARASASASSAPAPRPGQYRVTTTVTGFTMPGMSGQAAEQARSMFSATGHVEEFCLTAADAGSGFEPIARRAARGDCTFQRLAAGGGRLDAAMTCRTGRGMATASKLAGTATPEGAELTVTTDASMAGMPGGGMHMESRMTAQRIGDCQ